MDDAVLIPGFFSGQSKRKKISFSESDLLPTLFASHCTAIVLILPAMLLSILAANTAEKPLKISKLKYFRLAIYGSM